MAHERAGALVVVGGMAAFVLYAFWPRGKPCPTCPPQPTGTTQCPTGEFPAVNGSCPQGYAADPSVTGCCVYSGGPPAVSGCATCPPVSV